MFRNKIKKKLSLQKIHADHNKRNPYQDIVSRYSDNTLKYNGAQTIDFSISAIMNKLILWTIISLQFVYISALFLIYLIAVVIQNDVVLRVWVLGGLYDIVFHWGLFIIIVSFSLFLCNVKNQIYYYYILWIVLAIHTIWDSVEGLYWLNHRSEIVNYHHQIEGITFYIILAFFIYGIFSQTLIILLSTIGMMNLPSEYAPVTNFGVYIKKRQNYYQKAYITKLHHYNDKIIRRQNIKRKKLIRRQD